MLIGKQERKNHRLKILFLQELLLRVTKVQIKDGGVSRGEAMGKEVMLVIEKPEHL